MAFNDDFVTGSYPQFLENRSGWTRVDGTANDAYISASFPGTLSSDGASQTAYRCTDQGSADHYTEVVWGDATDTPSFVCVRITDSNNFIGFRNTANNWQVFKRVAGTFTQLGSDYAAAPSPGDVVRLRAEGNTIILTVNGVQRCLGAGVTESFNNTETRQGIVSRNSGTSSWLDSFNATSLAASPPVITGHPSNATVTEPATANFTATATDATSLQWQVSTNGGSSWSNVSDGTGGTTGTTSGSYTTSATAVSSGNHRNGYQYRCGFTNASGTTYTNAATLTVNAPAGGLKKLPVLLGGGFPSLTGGTT